MAYDKVAEVGSFMLYRGPRPTSEDDIRGMDFDINLESGWFDFFHDSAGEERAWCELCNAKFFNIPLSDLTPPTVEQLRTIVLLIQDLLTKGDVLVHCLHGEDRTGMVIAAYRILVDRWSVSAATNEMFGFGFHKIPYFFWISTLNQLAAPLERAV